MSDVEFLKSMLKSIITHLMVKNNYIKYQVPECFEEEYDKISEILSEIDEEKLIELMKEFRIRLQDLIK